MTISAIAAALADKAVTLRTARLTLRPYERDDTDALARALGDIEVARWLARVPHPYTRDDAVGFVEASLRAGPASPGFAILFGGRLVGGIGLRRSDDTTELGYWLARDHWGRGLMTEAAAAVVAHGFGAMGLPEIRSGVFVGNEASLAIQKRLGFEIVGRHMVHSVARGESVLHIDTRLVASRKL